MTNLLKRFINPVFDDTPQKSSILDTPVPSDFNQPILSPTPARRGIKRLTDLARKAVTAAKQKWNEFYDWLIDYVPQPIRRVNSSIENLKKKIKALYPPVFTPIEKQRAVKGYFRTFTIAGEDRYDPLSYLRAVEKSVVGVIESNLDRGMKVKLVLQCDMEKINPATGEAIIQSPYFSSKLKTILQKDVIKEEYRDMSEEILENIARYQREGSNWNFRRIVSLDIHLNKYEPLSGSSYIPLPKV